MVWLPSESSLQKQRSLDPAFSLDHNKRARGIECLRIEDGTEIAPVVGAAQQADVELILERQIVISFVDTCKALSLKEKDDLIYLLTAELSMHFFVSC